VTARLCRAVAANGRRAEVQMANVPTIIRRILKLQPAICNLRSEVVLLGASGRKVVDLKPSTNDVSTVSPGVYFLGETKAQAQAQAIQKVILAR
jgi:hypothetical protein